ncbi:amidohydrolase family protein [Methylocapsa sp. S129]|uniref:N-acyl-D-amino-acid deacylase family protein n=1 Tax=Methylocapsa sp. S129 TaxID=1641869 RepID=UPI00131E908E|nr:D-aminoacylase [Methylocapsa sp. S129]
MPQDTLIRDVRVIDGAGAPWFIGDVRLSGDRIGAVGPGQEVAGAIIVEGRGRYLAPGFIDAHCHDDLITLREPARPEKILQGVTTVVVGNCSFSLYPTAHSGKDLLRQHFSSLLGETQADEVFDDFSAYRQALHDRGAALNVVSLVGHAALRLATMGFVQRAASADERRAMQDLLALQLAQGAAGLSLGLVYPPSAYADEAELIALAETVRDHGKLLAAHIRSYEAGLLASIDEFIAILRAAGCAGLLSHLQSAGRPNWGSIPKALTRLEKARGEGVDVSFDMYPYPAGSSYILQLLPPEAQAGGHDALLARLRDPAARAALRRWVEVGGGDAHIQSKVSLIGWENVRLSAIAHQSLKHLEGRNMVEAAALARLEPFDLMAQLIEADRGQTGIVLFQLDETDLRCACTHRLHMFGSDGLPRPGTKPHPRAYGTFPRVLGHLTRDAGWFPLEDAVRRMTSIPAQRFGLADRGLVREGLMADLVLFDGDIADHATFDDPTRLPSGLSHVWVAGVAVVLDGQPTGRLPGRLIGAP